MPTVLIADDDVDHRELMHLVLRRSGYDVLEAANTQAAKSLLDAGGVDALLLDLHMPGESGIEFCRRLRAEPETRALPVMFVTAATEQSRVTAAMRAGGDDYLTKPFHRTELTSRLADVLRRRPFSPAQSSGPAHAAVLAARHALYRPAVTREADLARPVLQIA